MGLLPAPGAPSPLTVVAVVAPHGLGHGASPRPSRRPLPSLPPGPGPFIDGRGSASCLQGRAGQGWGRPRGRAVFCPGGGRGMAAGLAAPSIRVPQARLSPGTEGAAGAPRSPRGRGSRLGWGERGCLERSVAAPAPAADGGSSSRITGRASGPQRGQPSSSQRGQAPPLPLPCFHKCSHAAAQKGPMSAWKGIPRPAKPLSKGRLCHPKGGHPWPLAQVWVWCCPVSSSCGVL